MKKIIPFVFLLLWCFIGKAAYMENVPQTIIQPNGDTLHCFASGDEYYHYLHDAEGFTIVQNPQTGFFVYAIREHSQIIPSNYVAGKVNPRQVGLTPHIRISATEWQNRRTQRWANVPSKNSPKTSETNHGTLNNLVVFIKFAEEGNFSNSFSDVNKMFNDSSTVGCNSLYNYFKNISYQQLFIQSHFFPTPENDLIVAYEDIYPQNYYCPYSETNPEGYAADDDGTERTEREMALLARASRFVADLIPTDLNLDYNNDGYVDNVCFVIKGDVMGWNDLLWPHRWSLYTEDVEINNKRVYDFNFQLSDNIYYFTPSTLCHEMFHTLGAPDLYHYSDEFFTPVGSWDMMASTSSPRAQNPGAWMKYRYGNWLEEIPTITESGTYTVYPVGGNSNERIAYIIPSEIENEFFVVECRKKSNTFDLSIPESGLLIYHINSDFVGNAEWDGVDFLDEVYIYRPDGTLTEDGDISEAAFKQSNSRTRFDYSTNPQPFLSNGYISAIRIYNITSHIDSITFSYLKPGDPIDTTLLAESALNTLSVAPNPAQQSVFIHLPDNFESGLIEFFDMTGKLCLSQRVHAAAHEVDISSLNSGLYIVRAFSSDHKILYTKIIKE